MSWRIQNKYTQISWIPIHWKIRSKHEGNSPIYHHIKNNKIGNWGKRLVLRTQLWCVVCVRVHTQARAALCNPMACSLPGSSVHGISQARTPEQVAFPMPVVLPEPGTKPTSPVSPALAGRFFTTEPAGKPTQKTMILMKEIIDDTNWWRDMPYSWIGRLNNMKMTIPTNATYRFNTIPIQLLRKFFTEIEQKF